MWPTTAQSWLQVSPDYWKTRRECWLYSIYHDAFETQTDSRYQTHLPAMRSINMENCYSNMRRPCWRWYGSVVVSLTLLHATWVQFPDQQPPGQTTPSSFLCVGHWCTIPIPESESIPEWFHFWLESESNIWKTPGILYEVLKISVIQSDIRALPRIDYGFIQVAPPWGKQIMHLKLCIWLYWVIQWPDQKAVVLVVDFLHRSCIVILFAPSRKYMTTELVPITHS